MGWVGGFGCGTWAEAADWVKKIGKSDHSCRDAGRCGERWKRWKRWDGESRRWAEGGRGGKGRGRKGRGAKILWWVWNESSRVIERLNKKTEFEVPTTAKVALESDLNAE
jgi:hypothetical protein